MKNETVMNAGHTEMPASLLKASFPDERRPGANEHDVIETPISIIMAAYHSLQQAHATKPAALTGEERRGLHLLMKESRRDLDLLYMEIAVLDAMINKERARKQQIIKNIDEGIQKEKHPGTIKAMKAARKRTEGESAAKLRALHGQRVEAISKKRELDEDRRIMKSLLYPDQSIGQGIVAHDPAPIKEQFNPIEVQLVVPVGARPAMGAQRSLVH